MLYFEAARILQSSDELKGSVKSLCLSSKYKNKKQLYALVCETLKYRDVLSEIADVSRLTKLEKSLQSGPLTHVLLYDLLIGPGIGAAPKAQKTAILKHKAALHAALARLKVKAKVTSNKELLSAAAKNEVALPRYVRVNLIKTTVRDVIEHFKSEDFTLLPTKGLKYESFVATLSSLKPKQFVVDLHLPELLIFPAKTDLHDHVLYTSGDIILQDKASCIPAHVLAPPPGCHVIDCCAAPGNKSTHVAAHLTNRGKVFAFDLDAGRLATMGTLTLRAGALCVELLHQDFLKVDPLDQQYSRVTHAIVDPSCSGSGIVSRLNNLTDKTDSKATSRLTKLARFQQSILSRALSFPSMQRVVYSTCSIHKEENEQVVAAVLKKYSGKYRLAPAVPELPSRGDTMVFPEADQCLRLDPQQDLTNGFFVACFERLPQDMESQAEVEEKASGAEETEDVELLREEGASEVSTDKKRKKEKKTSIKSDSKGMGDDEISRLKPGSEGGTEGTSISADTSPSKVKKKRNKSKRKHAEIRADNEGSAEDKIPLKRKLEVPNTSVVEKKSKTIAAQKKNQKRNKKKKRNHKPVTS